MEKQCFYFAASACRDRHSRTHSLTHSHFSKCIKINVKFLQLCPLSDQHTHVKSQTKQNYVLYTIAQRDCQPVYTSTHTHAHTNTNRLSQMFLPYFKLVAIFQISIFCYNIFRIHRSQNLIYFPMFL